MNFTADLVATTLFGLEVLKNKVCRVYSTQKEDIFNVSIKELPEWSILYKMLFDTDELDDYTFVNTTFDELDIDMMPQEAIEQAAKFQVEFYFGQTNYLKDEYLRDAEGRDRWIPLSLIYQFNKVRTFQNRLTIEQLATVMRLSTVVDITLVINKFGDEQYMIRKKNLQLNGKYVDFFGYNVETIKKLTKQQFEMFLGHKDKFEQQILERKPIIVTTVGKATTKAMAERKFKRVIMDEATMVKDYEAFLTALNAEQIVLIGDQKQLGPTYSFAIDGPTSLFSRLIEAGHDFDFLDTQYRMHKSLMDVPNMLYYNNRINCGY